MRAGKNRENEKALPGDGQRLYHAFGPLFDERSEILILGSFPSIKSREQHFYYGHPRNRFWGMLADIFGEKEPETQVRWQLLRAILRYTTLLLIIPMTRNILTILSRLLSEPHQEPAAALPAAWWEP